VTVFLIDEDLPRLLAARLRTAGLMAEDVRDVGLGGQSDAQIHAHAVANGRVVVTRDVGFARMVRALSRTHAGIIVVRFPTVITIEFVNESITAALHSLAQQDFRNSFVVIEPGRVRLWRPGPGQDSR